MAILIRAMSAADIPACMVLKGAAGWNQTEQDWSNVITLEPEGCWVAEVDGSIAGSTTAVCWGRELAWIGMVLVLPEYRRRGIARALMERAMEYCRQRQVRCVKLDATEMGKPLYEQFGFTAECPIERWRADEFSLAALPAGPQPWAAGSAAEILELDRAAFGADRGSLLHLLVSRQPADCVVLDGGFAMSRPGSNARFLGPCIARDPDTARRLIRAALRPYAGQPVFWDLLPENAVAVELARELGFSPRRQLVRMGVGPECGRRNRAANVKLQFAASGFEYG